MWVIPLPFNLQEGECLGAFSRMPNFKIHTMAQHQGKAIIYLLSQSSVEAKFTASFLNFMLESM